MSSRVTMFNNNWNNIHDFTPVPGEPNYSALKMARFEFFSLSLNYAKKRKNNKKHF